MNLDRIRPGNEKEDIFLSITKNCETLIEQTHRRPEETLELKNTKPKQIFHCNLHLSIEGVWMIGLTSLEVYNSIFIITEEKNKFKLYAGPPYTKLPYTELKDKVAEVHCLSDISSEHLSHEKLGPDFIEINRKLSIERRQTDGYYILLKIYLRTPFRDFESYLRI